MQEAAVATPRPAPVLDPYASKGRKQWPRYRLVHEVLQEARLPGAWMEFTPGRRVLFIRDPDMVNEVLADSDRFPRSLPGESSLPELLGQSMSNENDPVLHRQRREVLAPHFRPAYVGALVPRLTRTAQAAAATLATLSRSSSRGCDVEDLFRRVVLDNFGRTDLGYEFHAVEDLAKSHDQRHLYDGLEFLEVWDRMMTLAIRVGGALEERQAHPQYPAYTGHLATVRSILRERMAASRQLLQSAGANADPAQHTDLVALLLQQQASGAYPNLTDQVIEDELMLLMVGGFDTTAAALSWTLHHLLAHPPAMAATLAEISAVAAGRPLPSLTFEDYRRMEYLMACVTETLRLNVPLANVSRRPVADITLAGGLQVPAGSFVFLPLYALHHHEAVFERAEEWLPQRWLPDGPQELKPKHKDALLPFGAGPRICLGRQYALLALPVMLAQLLGTVRLARAPGAPAVQVGPAVVARSSEGIWVTAEPLAVAVGTQEQ